MATSGPAQCLTPSVAPVHLDRTEFTAYCARVGVVPSMGSIGVCWDSVARQSFVATLKNEMHHCHNFTTRARFAVVEYIEVFYDRNHQHSSVECKTPVAALTQHQVGHPA